MIKTTNHQIDSSSLGLQRTILAISISAALGLISTVASAEESTTELSAIEINDTSLENADTTYAGGQVNTQTNIGLLGNQSTFNTPYSIISFTSDLIEDQQVDTVGDVLANDSSAQLSTAGGNIEEIIIRGFSTGSSVGEGGADLYDGLPYLSNNSRTSTTMLERVDILKGANALLTGNLGAAGGVVNTVPKMPIDTPLTRLTTSYASNSEFGTHLDLSRRFGEDDEFGIRINGAIQDGEGIKNEEDELKELGVALQYKKDKLQLDAIFDRTSENSSGSHKAIGVSNITNIPDASNAKSLKQDWEYFNTTFERNYIKAQYEISDTWSIHAAYGESYYSQELLSGYNEFNADGDTGDVTQYMDEIYQNNENTSMKIGMEGIFDTGSISHQVAFDVMQANNEEKFFYNYTDYVISSNIYNPTKADESDYDFDLSDLIDNAYTNYVTNTKSFAIADTIGFSDDQVLLTLGARHQNIESIYYSSEGVKGSDYDESAITPTIGILVKSTPSLSLYANYIESLSEGEKVDDDYDNAGEILDPFVSKQLEFGAKWNLDTVALSTAIFRITKPSAFADDNNNYDTNGEQVNQGIELNAFGNLTESLRFLGGVTYLDAKHTKTEDGDYDGKNVIGVSKFTAVANLDWDIQSVEGLTLNARMNHYGSQYLDNDNTVEIPSYELYSIGALYITKIANKDVTFRANVNNLLDEAYWTSYPGNTSIVLGDSRQLNLSVAVDF